MADDDWKKLSTEEKLEHKVCLLNSIIFVYKCCYLYVLKKRLGNVV